MSFFDDYSEGDIERHNEIVTVNLRDRYEREHMFDDPDYPNPESDEWREEHCPVCKYYREHEDNGRIWAECECCTCDFEREDEE